MAYTRQYTEGVGWENEPSISTPISAENLNQMDEAIQHVDEAAYNEFTAVYAAIAQAGGKVDSYHITSVTEGTSEHAPRLNMALPALGLPNNILMLFLEIDAVWSGQNDETWEIYTNNSSIYIGQIRDYRRDNGILFIETKYRENIQAGSVMMLTKVPNNSNNWWALRAIIPAASGGGGSGRVFSDHIVSSTSALRLNTSTNFLGDENFAEGDILFLYSEVDVTHGDNNYTVSLGGTKIIGRLVDYRNGNDENPFQEDISAGTTLVITYTASELVYKLRLRAVIPAASGGGTTVVANPTGAATATLGKLQVGSTIYEIPTIDQAWAGKVTTVSGGNITPNNASFPVDPFTASNFVVLDIGVDAVMPGSVTKWSLQYTVDGNTVTKGISDGRNGNSYDPNFDDNLVAGTTMILQKVGNNFSCLAVLDGGGASALSDLTDTAISTPSDGQFLKYDATSGKWINTDSGGRGYACDLLFENDPLPTPESGTANTTRTYTLSKSINDYDAVVVTSYGQHNSQAARSEGGTILILKSDYNIGTTGEYDKEINTSWGDQAKILAFSFPDDTTIKTHGGRTTSGNEPMLHRVYGLKFAKGGGGASSLADLSDTAISSPADGQILGYNGTSGKWESTTPPTIPDISVKQNITLDTPLSIGGVSRTTVESALGALAEQASYLEQAITLSTSASTTVTFTDSSITANSFIEYACSQWDLVPESITAAAGSCTIVLPKVDSAQSVTVRIYVR